MALFGNFLAYEISITVEAVDGFYVAVSSA